MLESANVPQTGALHNTDGLEIRLGDNSSNLQYRGMLSFNTTWLPDDAVITSVKLYVHSLTVIGVNPMDTHQRLLVDVTSPYFGIGSALQANDFQAYALGSAAAYFAPAPEGNWYVAVFGPGALSSINANGLTQMRLRFELPTDNDNSADVLYIWSGNAIVDNRPRLEITFYINP